MASGAPDKASKAGGNKKLIIIITVLALLVLVGGGVTAALMKQRADAAAMAEEDEDDYYGAYDEPPRQKARPQVIRKDPKVPPTFVPLDPFVVNLADKESDRFAQIGVTLEVDDAQSAEQIKAYMPAIRNGILMVLSSKTSAELLTPEGKRALSQEILRESVLPLGIDVGNERLGRRAADLSPVSQVHFSNFIVQ